MRMKMCNLLLIIVARYFVIVFGFECSQFDTNMGATFDLTDLVRTPEEPTYVVTDGDLPCTTDVVEQNFTYMFNICNTVVGGVPPACATLAGLHKAGALQIDKKILTDPNDDYCFLAGVYGDQATSLALLDQEDPTKGLALTYYGDYCHHPMDQRRFRIELLCADKLNPIPTHALEYAHCSYTVTLPSVYGCPLECPVADRHLCGGNGHCAYDVDKGAARCFCNHGFSGKSCTAKSKSSSSDDLNYSPALLGLIISLFVIIALLVAGVFLMIRQLAAYKEDVTNYQALRGEESEAI